MCQICKGTWLPLLRLSLQKLIVVPVDRLQNVVWTCLPALLRISLELVHFLVDDSHYEASRRTWLPLAFWRVQWSLLCTDRLRWESAGISEAWGSASIPASAYIVLCCHWR